MKRTLLAIAIIVLLTVMIRMPNLNVPFERDEGEYAYIAWRLGYGELPYRDWIDQKPPGVFWVYRAALGLPLNPLCAVHVMGLLFSTCSACALFWLARRFVSRSWATVAAILLAVLSAEPLIEGTAANTELFMLLPLILSQLAFLSAASKGPRWILMATLSGVLTGLAVAFKQVAAVNWLFLIVLWPFFAAAENRLRSTLWFAGWSTAGLAAVWGATLTYFFLHRGLDHLVYNVFTHNLDYVHSLSCSVRYANLVNTLGVLCRTEALVWIFSAVGLLALGLTRRTKPLLFLGGGLLASMIGVSASGYYFPHYFQQMLPPLPSPQPLAPSRSTTLAFVGCCLLGAGRDFSAACSLSCRRQRCGRFSSSIRRPKR